MVKLITSNFNFFLFLKFFFLFFAKKINNFLLIKISKQLNYSEVLNILNRRQKQKFYVPGISLWPFFLSIFLGLTVLSFVSLLYNMNKVSFLFFLFFIILTFSCVIFWFSVFFVEKQKGNHVFFTRENVKLGFYIFVCTEALCFIAVFWIFLHSFLAAGLHIGLYNPGEGAGIFYMNEMVKMTKNFDFVYFNELTARNTHISTIYHQFEREFSQRTPVKVHINLYDYGCLVNPYKLPFYNTLILLCSAAALNCSHVNLKMSKFFASKVWLSVTVFLGLFFVSMQYIEYRSCNLNYNDGIYSACFFSLTGLHGFHVIIGVIALIICLVNLIYENYSPNFHQSFFYAIIYWHFVDIIWLFVFVIMYWWPSSYFFSNELNFFYVKDTKSYTISLSLTFFMNLLDTLSTFYHIQNQNKFYESFKNFFYVKEYSFNNSFQTDLDFNLLEEFENNFFIYNKEDNISVGCDYIEEILFATVVYLKEYINWNEIKRDPRFFNFVLNQLHFLIFSLIDGNYKNTVNLKENYFVTLFDIKKNIYNKFLKSRQY